MIKYSHVRLLVLCNEDGVANVTRTLGVDPSEVANDEEATPPQTGLTHTWCLDSPLGTDGVPTARLAALAGVIEPFADKLLSLDAKYKRFIDIVYHVTPQHVGGIAGEFDWFCCPAELMRRISGWNLDVSYETFWFDHPDWERLKYPWWQRWFKRLASKTT